MINEDDPYYLTNPLNNLIINASSSPDFGNTDIGKLAPFIEQMGSGIKGSGEPWKKEFWWERVWGDVGDLILPEKIIGVCREEEIEYFERF